MCALGIADVVHDEHLSRLRGYVGAPLQDATGIGFVLSAGQLLR